CALFFFFFQAEDGIRDRTVTGVQTCALPISPVHFHTVRQPVRLLGGHVEEDAPLAERSVLMDRIRHPELPLGVGVRDVEELLVEIGRASCRERGWVWGGAG